MSIINSIIKLIETILALLPLDLWKKLLGLILRLFAKRFNIPDQVVIPLLKWLGLDAATLDTELTAIIGVPTPVGTTAVVGTKPIVKAKPIV